MNFGGMWLLLTMKQREAEQEAQLRLIRTEVAADLRHEELLAGVKRASAAAGRPVAPVRPYAGATVAAATLGLPDFAGVDLPADESGLRAVLDPVNLLVIGGDTHAGLAAATAVQKAVGGRLEVLDLAAATDPVRSVRAVAGPDGLKGADVLFLPSIDTIGAESVERLSWLLDIIPAAPWLERTRTRLETMEPFASLTPEEREAKISVKPEANGEVVRRREEAYIAFAFTVVAHSASGRIPLPLASGHVPGASGNIRWGGLLTAPKDTKTCPQCAEEVKAAALLCRYCRYEFGPLPPPGHSGF